MDVLPVVGQRRWGPVLLIFLALCAAPSVLRLHSSSHTCSGLGAEHTSSGDLSGGWVTKQTSSPLGKIVDPETGGTHTDTSLRLEGRRPRATRSRRRGDLGAQSLLLWSQLCSRRRSSVKSKQGSGVPTPPKPLQKPVVVSNGRQPLEYPACPIISRFLHQSRRGIEDKHGFRQRRGRIAEDEWTL